MSAIHHLRVKAGPDTGMLITVPAAGARLGRSAKNDIVLGDPLLSRHHCRLYFKPGDGLFVTDLASANGTMVNKRAIQDQQVVTGDLIQVGDTVIEVLSDSLPELPAAPAVSAAGAPVVDLGLNKTAGQNAATARRSIGRLPLTIAAVLVTLIALAAWAPKIIERAIPPPPSIPVAPKVVEDMTLDIEYEKVQATSGNIFRYYLRIAPDRTVSIQIDDIVNDRHVRKEKKVDQSLLGELAGAMRDGGFMALSGDYSGIKPDVIEQFDLSLTIGRRTHRVRVLNRVEPDDFKKTREMIEEFGKIELGLHAIQFSPEKLRQMAGEAYLLARKLYDERDVKYANIALSVRHFDEADLLLETIEPKPDYYADIVRIRNDAKRDLEQRYEDQKFRAERSIRLRDWPEASAALQAICELIPDRADSRNEEARKQLLDVQRRMNTR